MKVKINQYKNYIISIIFLVIVTIALLSFLLQFKNLDLSTPIVYMGSDDYSILNTVKTISDNGWIFENKYIGAPFGTENYDYPSSLLINFDTLIIKILLFFTHDIFMTANLFYFLLFVLVSIISYITMKSLKINDYVSVLGSLTFGFSPYIFYRGVAHITLSSYPFVPLSILLCIWIYHDELFLCFNRKFYKYEKNYVALLICLLISNNGIAYYPFFTCFLLLVTGLIKAINIKKWSHFFKGIVPITAICIFMLIDLIPVIKYHMVNGPNSLAVGRDATAAEIYGLKITQLFMPINAHGIKTLGRIVTNYNLNAPLINENVGSYLGLIGIAGFIILILTLFIRKANNELMMNLKLLSELNISAVLLGTIGGIGSLFAMYISPMIRGYNRISIFILFISILAICFIADDIYKKIPGKKIFILAMTIIFSFSILEQFPGIVPDYVHIKNQFNSDKNFIRTIENDMPKGAMVFQLPYHPYPESGPVKNMADYQLLTGYLHSKDLKWSYGGMKGRRSDFWNRTVASLDLEEMVKTLSVAGFEGIYIDKRAYDENEYSVLEQQLSVLLNTRPIYSDNNNLTFFNMKQFNIDYRKLYSQEELNSLIDRILNMNTIRFGEGITGIEGEKPDQWIWLSNPSVLFIDNYSESQESYNLKMKIASTSAEKSSLVIKVNKQNYNYDIDNNGIEINETIKLNNGINKIEFITNAPQLYAPNDPRDLYLIATDFNFYENLGLK